MDDVHREYASVAAQHEMGIAPSLDDPPPDPPSSNGEA
jgi:hypothetical protein